MSIRRVFLDCEFIPQETTNRGLLSVGLVDDNDESLYMINAEADWSLARQQPFLLEHVLPKIRTANIWQSAAEVDPTNWEDPFVYSVENMQRRLLEYFSPMDWRQTVLYAWCGQADLFRVQGLWNHNWSEMPQVIPHWFQDIEGLLFLHGINEAASDFPKHTDGQHHALVDAFYDRDVFNYIERKVRG